MAASSSTGATEDIIIIINTQLLLLLRCGVSFGKTKNKTPSFFTKPFFNQNQVLFLLLLLNRKSEKLSFVATPSNTAIPATTPSLLCVCFCLSVSLSLSLSLYLRARESAATAATSVAMTEASDGELHMGERERKGQNRLATR
jgi:hypothetical protein